MAISEEQRQRAIELIDQGFSWNEVAAKLHVNKTMLRLACDQSYVATYRAVAERAHGRRRSQSTKTNGYGYFESSQAASKSRSGLSLSREPESVAAIQDRDRRAQLPLTPSQMLLGDPPPGRSALDQLRAEGRFI